MCDDEPESTLSWISFERQNCVGINTLEKKNSNYGVFAVLAGSYISAFNFRWSPTGTVIKETDFHSCLLVIGLISIFLVFRKK